MSPTEELKQEHRVIEKVLRALIVASKRMQKGEDIDPEIFKKSVDFVRNYADRCHHGKEEENLFPAIERHGYPREGGPVGMMLMEHEEGRNHIRQVAAALEDYEKGARTPQIRTAIFGNAIGYARLLAQHIEKEDNILYQIADSVIPASERAELSGIFREVQERTAGDGKYEAYARVAEELETVLQAAGTRL